MLLYLDLTAIIFSAVGKAFNLVNPNRLKFDKEMQLLVIKVPGLTAMKYGDWKRDVLPKLGKEPKA